MPKIPRSSDNDYTHDMSRTCREFIAPETLSGNIENFAGVAQVPIGFAGPMLVNGEHAKGEFYVPMATTEGTLTASYSRGMRLTRGAGSITTTVIDDAMWRPVFGFCCCSG